MRYRSKTEIIGQILAIANGNDVTKTRIMYKAFLSFEQSKGFLKAVTESGLLRFDEKTKTFRTTEKGLKFLHLFTELCEIMEGIKQNQTATLKVVAIKNT